MSEWARPAAEPGDVDVFPTGTTIARAPEPPPDDGPGVGELLRRGGEAMRDGYEHARDFRARPGHRPGAVSQASAREGGETDIVRPVLIDPTTACRLALSGELFADPVRHLDVDAHEHDGERYLVWDAVVTSDRGRGVPATLHLLASPSMVVTVLELVPRRRLRWTRDRFVRDGIVAVEELALRLERARRAA